MNTVVSEFTSDYRIKGSKFFGFLSPASNTAEAEEHLTTIRKEYPTATHHCYGYLISPNNPVEFSSDDGEPSGTAGRPILNELKSHDLINVILIVVRYYGGTKLGKSGLIDAYQTSARQAIESAALKKLYPVKTYLLEYDYTQQALIEKWKNMFTWFELNSSYLESVALKVSCPVTESERFERTVAANKHLIINFKPLGDSFHIKN